MRMSRKGMEKMNFQECLNNYIIQIRCNGKELARNSENIRNGYQPVSQRWACTFSWQWIFEEIVRWNHQDCSRKRHPGFSGGQSLAERCVKVWRITGTNRYLTVRNSTFCWENWISIFPELRHFALWSVLPVKDKDGQAQSGTSSAVYRKNLRVCCI